MRTMILSVALAGSLVALPGCMAVAAAYEWWMSGAAGGMAKLQDARNQSALARQAELQAARATVGDRK